MREEERGGGAHMRTSFCWREDGVGSGSDDMEVSAALRSFDFDLGQEQARRGGEETRERW